MVVLGYRLISGSVVAAGALTVLPELCADSANTAWWLFPAAHPRDGIRLRPIRRYDFSLCDVAEIFQRQLNASHIETSSGWTRRQESNERRNIIKRKELGINFPVYRHDDFNVQVAPDESWADRPERRR